MQRARDELAVTLAREHELALAHSRLQDRLDIARDLHDGLGGSLVRMTALVEQSGAPLQNRQFLSMLNLLRNDLRQTIDSSASADMKPPATPRGGSRRCATATRSCSTSWASKSAGMFRLLVVPPSALQCLADPSDRGRTDQRHQHSRAGRVAVRLAQPGPGRWNSWSRRRRGLRRGRRVPGRHQRRHAQHVHAHRPGRRQLADRFRARPHAPDRQPDPGGGRRRAAPATASAQDVSKIASGRNSGNSATFARFLTANPTTIAVIHNFSKMTRHGYA